ncbi:hypothetical protein V7148_00155 [Gottfriedia acidiceleris]|uniref:hypothetical protein n=1 Tax=Gottfriedia acidiceleris TaxID=371036 RepID=UPI003000A8C2
MRKAKKFIILVFTFFSLFLVGANQSSAAKKVITVTSNHKGQTGITVATHLSTTTFLYDGSKLFSPKAVDTGYWTAPLNGVSGTSSKWDWYNSSSGRSNSLVKFYFGIPTPWGAVGSNYSNRIYTEVFKNGSFKY